MLLDRDHAQLARRKARAILEYLDWKPFEEIFTRGVLEAASDMVDKGTAAAKLAASVPNLDQFCAELAEKISR